MNKLTCTSCGTVWCGGELRPKCPNCLAQQWLSSPGMISPKHDPSLLPSAYSTFRSVLPNGLLEHPDKYYRAIAIEGTALWSNRHKKYCYVWGGASHLTAGSAIPSGSAMPTRPMDSFVVADAFGSNPHIYADDDMRIQSFLAKGEYQLLPLCSVTGCSNSQMPGTCFCASHMNPPMAE